MKWIIRLIKIGAVLGTLGILGIIAGYFYLAPQIPSIDGIREIALSYPRLPLVVSHVMGGLGIHPALVPLIRRTRSLYLDTSGILEFWREVARDVGPDRVVFATGVPFTDPGMLVSNVQYARSLDDDAKRLISGDTVRRLMAGAGR